MEKTIICLSGPANKGKTTSVKKLYKLLGGKDMTHYSEIVDYVKYHDCIIGFSSVGDPNSAQEEDLEIMLKKDCDIVITASRTYGSTVEILERLAEQYHYRVIRYSLIYMYMYDDIGENLFSLSHEGNIHFIHTIIDKLIKGEAL